MLAEYHGCEHEDVSIFGLPATGSHARLGTGFFKELLPIPPFFDRDLREQKAFMIAVPHEQTVLPNLDLSNIEHAPHGREYRDFVFQLWCLRGRYRLETGIT